MPAAAMAEPPVGLAAPAPDVMPVKALLVTGGCCHDYEAQHKILFEGIQRRANVRVDVVFYRSNPSDPIGVTAGLPMPVFRDPAWAEGYDVVIHDECVALNDDPTTMRNILAAHETTPAVHLHCALHSFRGQGGSPGNFTAKHHEAWCRQIGLMSVRHGPHLPVAVKFVSTSHPIVQGLTDWLTDKEELYNNEVIYGAEPLARGTQTYQRNGVEVTDEAVVVWVNDNNGVRTFSTSLGHYNHNVEDPRYLELVTRGLLWACNRLDDDRYRQAYTGTNKLTIIEPNAERANLTKQLIGQAAGNRVTVTAKSTQQSPAHPAAAALDGQVDTRWCGDGPTMPSWLQLEFQQPVSLSAAEIVWEFQHEWMRYTIETSGDGKVWRTAFDAAANNQAGVRRDRFSAADVRYLRVNVLKQQRGMWPSVREVRLFDKTGSLLPVQANTSNAAVPAIQATAYAKAGNIPPRPHRLSSVEENKLLAEVAVPEGFDLTLFAPWQMANYPTYLAAAPNGDVYVSSDGNGSLGRQPHRGRVLRLRDTDVDGRADEVTEFIRDIDSPRGLVWDHDRLYVLHPPHIDVFFDQDDDGMAESSRRLVSNIAFGFEKRPADHTTNGLEMGVDGWIYIAVGDFGFMEATGSDGQTLQMRGGGVVRFRPDGSGLEVYADGTRNIYGISVTPTLDLFARDNTNDGGGWNVRFHHLSGLEDHGYPRLFRNFADEIIAPLADYGGGSGCGACFLEEPGVPAEWNGQVYTCDWGRSGSFRHSVQRRGAGFEEQGEPERFFQMPRPTDIDIDGRSGIYQASWQGPATFGWKGPEHGFIARATPGGFKPSAVPEFAELTDSELVSLLRESPSHVRRLAAQRMLLRRSPNADAWSLLSEVMGDRSLPLANRVAALYAVSQRGLDSSMSAEVLQLLLKAVPARDPLMPLVIRSCGDFGSDRKPVGSRGPVPTETLRQWLASSEPRSVLEAIITATRQNAVEVADDIAAHFASADAVIVHTVYRALTRLQAADATFRAFDQGPVGNSRGASLALMRMHSPEVVTGLHARLETARNPEVRELLLATLARLAQREAPWQGDSWSTRPDTRGPYYQPEAWQETPRILDALTRLLTDPQTPAEEASFIVAVLGRNRISDNQHLEQTIELARKDSRLVPPLLQQLAAVKDLPPQAVPLVIAAARGEETTAEVLLIAVRLLLPATHADAFPAVIDALATLQQDAGARRERDQARDALLAAPTLQNHAELLATRFAREADGPTGEWLAAGLLQIAHAKETGIEPRDVSWRAIDQAWQQTAGRKALMQAASQTKIPAINDRIRAAVSDPDRNVAERARSTARRLGIQLSGEDSSPLVGILPAATVIERASAAMTGDIAVGEAVFTRCQCATCHTVSEDAPAKGPYLGSIASIYRRRQLAEAIMMPNKTIAQGFKTNLILLENGLAVTGFVTKESADAIVLRDATGKQHDIPVAAIAERVILPTSVMPAGLLNTSTIEEFAGLLAYLESLTTKQKASP